MWHADLPPPPPEAYREDEDEHRPVKSRSMKVLEDQIDWGGMFHYQVSFLLSRTPEGYLEDQTMLVGKAGLKIPCSYVANCCETLHSCHDVVPGEYSGVKRIGMTVGNPRKLP